MARRSREQQAAVADIGEIPAVVDPGRREACCRDLGRFLVEYFPHSTGLSPLSPDHLLLVAIIQDCALTGGKFVNAIYRGAAKTTISENAAIWALLYGHRRYVGLFGADANAASRMLASLKSELADNDLLYEDFPEVCHAVRALEGKVQRCASQTHDGRLTGIQWTADKVVLPGIAGSVSSFGVLSAHGLTAASRGLKHKRPDGRQQRPDFVIVDDPQTDESSVSPLQTRVRLDLIRRNILKLGGHRTNIACVVNATVIACDDLIEQLLDRKLNPSWQGVRIPMVRTFADRHQDLWCGEYRAIRQAFDPNVPGDQLRAHRASTMFYAEHRSEMDAGCVVSWESCFDPEHEISAIQHAYNELLDNGADVFAAECQQQPLRAAADHRAMDRSAVLAKANGLAAGRVPQWASTVTAFVDVQKSVLYWLVAGWGRGFSGHVLGYGMFPGQGSGSLALADVKRTLQDTYAGTGPEGAVRAGLDALTTQLGGREWIREDGAVLRTERIVVDSGFWAPVVYEFCRRSPLGALVQASKGRSVSARNVPMDLYRAKEGETLGDHWLLAPIAGATHQRLLHIDTNHWKSFVRDRLLTAVGDAGCLSVFGRPDDHGELASQWTAEYATPTEGQGRHLEEWTRWPGRDNHLWDCLVGSAVAASMGGIALIGSEPRPVRKPPRTVRYGDIQRQRNAAAGRRQEP